MKDLDAMLRKDHKMFLPRKGLAQFDNCSENKVIDIF